MKEIPLTTKDMVALVDDEDYPKVCDRRWYAQKNKKTFYAMSNVKRNGKWGGTIAMHRVILGAKKGQQVDHKNHNGLDNRRQNIRLCSHEQNCYNTRPLGTSRYKGVHKRADRKGRWRSEITVCKKKIYIGTFLSEEEAAKAYDSVARKLHGEFAFINFPVEATDKPHHAV